jgi:protease IV
MPAWSRYVVEARTSGVTLTMALDTEVVLERRRLRRRLSLWRVAAIAAVLFALAAMMMRANGVSGSTEPQIARVSFEGTIVEDRKMLKLLDTLAEEDKVKGVLLFVNSPGGTTTGAEGIFNAVREVAKKKPVVAQFSTLATSAGYILGLSADHIVARGNTITGSVGVLLQWPQVTDLMDKLGVEMKTVRSGTLKAAPNPFEPIDPEARRVAQDMVDDGFRWFVSLVKERRGVDPDLIPGLMKGRIFSGRSALSHKLIDQIGGEAEAIRWLEARHGLEKDLKVIDRKPKSDDLFGFGASASQWAHGMSGEAGRLADKLAAEWGFDRLALDGLISVWHPSEN